MSAETTRKIADRLVELCKIDDTETGLKELYADNIVSVEAMAMPGSDSREVAGMEALRGKHAWWDSAMEMIDSNVDGPFMHGDDRFAIIFSGKWRERESGTVMDLHEVAIYTVADEKIVREEFFYTM